VVADKKPVDWAAIEVDFRAGVKSVRVIASEYGVSHTAINKRAKREGWPQDLAERIRAKAADKVSRAAVSSKVSAQKAATDNRMVEASAQLQVDVILAHRQDIRRGREIVTALFLELGAKQLTDAELGALVSKCAEIKEMPADEAILLLGALIKSMDLGGRAQTAQRLASSLAALIDSERTAFSIDDRTRGANEVVEGLKRLASMPAD
jgi:hypothetical protein